MAKGTPPRTKHITIKLSDADKQVYDMIEKGGEKMTKGNPNGRPASAAPRVNTVTIKLSDAERQRLEETAAMLGITKTRVLVEGLNRINAEAAAKEAKAERAAINALKKRAERHGFIIGAAKDKNGLIKGRYFLLEVETGAVASIDPMTPEELEKWLEDLDNAGEDVEKVYTKM